MLNKRGAWLEDVTRASFRAAASQIIQFEGMDIGCTELAEEQSALALSKLYIAPSYQNRGIGALLMRQFIVRSNDSQRSIRLRVLRVNPARRFYERHGFLVTKTTQEHYFMERPSLVAAS